MEEPTKLRCTKRYKLVTEEKASGVTYTPKILADFVAQQIVQGVGQLPSDRSIRILDPAVGDGELLVSLLERLTVNPQLSIEVHGFETAPKALRTATARIGQQFPAVSVHIKSNSFLDFVLEQFGDDGNGSLFHSSTPETYDLIIANPPYVRTQIIGATEARQLANQFGLTGRVDLYYAFILAMADVLHPQGIAGIIVSNRFMTTKSGASVRRAVLDRFNVRHVWDLGDTKLFDAAVLPAVLGVGGKKGRKIATPGFTSIYETSQPTHQSATNVIHALADEGVVEVEDGRCFHVQHGTLNTGGSDDDVWRIATDVVDSWLATVASHTWGTFRDIGKIRVGVKTCADKVFIRSDWQDMANTERPELLKPLVTHHVARRFKALLRDHPRQILYPHEVHQGRRQAVDLSKYPRSKMYLERHRSELEGRKYVRDAGREWHEIWVPQDPSAWDETKLVFRDIAEKPTFWIDQNRSVVNGDCYWIVCKDSAQTDLLWLAAAIGNSTFIERFYDYRFHNKLYAGRRRFMTQYVENFPIPDPQLALSRAIISKSKQTYERLPDSDVDEMERSLDDMVWAVLCGGKDC